MQLTEHNMKTSTAEIRAFINHQDAQRNSSSTAFSIHHYSMAKQAHAHAARIYINSAIFFLRLP